MDIRPIRTKADHKAALRTIEELMEANPAVGSPEGDMLEVLLTLVDAYESKRFPIAPPDPIEAIRFRMDQMGLSPKDLVPAIGRVNRVYEVLSGKRELTLAMIRRLHKDFHIPAESLIGDPAET